MAVIVPKSILEAKDVQLYKRILHVFSDYCDKFPATGVGKLLRNLMEEGLKVLPKDPKAIEILTSILNAGMSNPAIVTKILNTRFVDLEVGEGRPVYQEGNSKKVAFWSDGMKLYDKVIGMISIEGAGSSKGSWTDAKGKKIKLLEL